MAKQIEADGRSVKITSSDRVYFPDAGITKGELVAYYERIAERMLPYLYDRPLTLHRFPEGIAGEGFFQQNASDYFPDWIARISVDKEDGGQVMHVMCNDAATLVYLANQATITFHAWLSRADRLHYPDRLVLDLDPSNGDVAGLRRAARQAGDLLRELGLTPFVMATGSSGFHVVAPLERAAPFDAVRDFARDLADLLAHRHRSSSHRAAQGKRGDRIFLDTLRNAYATRCRAVLGRMPGAPIATRSTGTRWRATPTRSGSRSRAFSAGWRRSPILGGMMAHAAARRAARGWHACAETRASRRTARRAPPARRGPGQPFQVWKSSVSVARRPGCRRRTQGGTAALTITGRRARRPPGAGRAARRSSAPAAASAPE